MNEVLTAIERLRANGPVSLATVRDACPLTTSAFLQAVRELRAAGVVQVRDGYVIAVNELARSE